VATAVSISYSAASGAGIHAGRYPGGRLSGAVALGDVAPGGGLGAAAATLSGGVSLDDVAPAGSMQTQAEFRYGALLGQSNMANAFSQNAHWPSGDSRATAYINSAGRRIGNIADSYPPGTLTDGLGGGSYTAGDALVDGDALVYLGNRLATLRGSAIMLHAGAISGSAISTWLTGGSSWTPYAAGVTASGKSPTWATWLQGESNAGGSMVTHASSLASVQAQLVSQSGMTAAAFGFAVIPLGPCTTGWTAEGNFGPVREVLVAHAASSTGAYLLNSALDASLIGSDNVHWTTDSYIRQARRIAEWVSRWSAGTGGSMAGPRITGATRVGAVITVTVAHAGGTTLADGAGGAGSALAGFRVYDGGTPMTISATAITNATTITLTLSATPAGTCTMDYAMANLPFGATAPAANTIVYDNTSVNGDSLGIPMQPKPLFTVT
jgi:hypothetical protein